MENSTILLSQKEVECSASVICLTPNKEDNITLNKTTKMNFDDPIELRNKHAALLEEVSGIF